MPVPTGSADPTSVMNKYRNNVTVLADSRSTDETRLKAAQEISENFEVIISSSQYHSFLETAIPHFLKVLKDEKPQFIAESPLQHLRKLLLELLHRMPTNEQLRQFVRQILELMFTLLETENEENVLVCLKIIIELHKYYRPTMQPEVQHFLQFVKSVYKDIQVNMKTYFLDVIPGTPAPDPMNIQLFVDKAGFSCQTIITIQQADGQKVQQTILPKGVNSLKVLAEYPIIVVLMYQLYKQNVHNVVADFIPLVMNTIGLQPTQQARASPNFNKEMYVDFIAAQIKTLSFLAYIIKIYQDLVNSYAPQMVKGMLGLFGNCPSEVAHLRKELLIAARHILGTDLRNKFVPSIDKLFEEHVLVGSGWTSKESLRPLAYSTLADLVHHVRQQLPLQHLSMAVHLFSKNVHDESLPCNIQTMSCKLLLNLVECIRQKSEQDSTNAREILMRMLEVFVLKFHTIADNQLPVIFDKCRQQQEAAHEKMLPPVSRSISTSSATAASITSTATTTTTTTSSSSSATLPPPPLTPTTPQTLSFPSLSTPSSAIPPSTPTTPAPPVTPGVSSITTAPLSSLFPTREKDDGKPKKYLPTGLTHFNNYSVVDCRSLVKTVVCGVKTITWGVSACKVQSDPNQSKQFHPKETAVFIKLVKHALKALDIYQIQISPTGQTSIRPANTQSVRLKEEKEVLEHFAGVFNMMHPLTFREIFQTTIEYMVERIYKNYALQLIANSFLANLSTSATFATILVEYLLERMEEMGTNQERSNLYLKLFKLVFGSVSLFASENEQMLKPHLHKIVNRSMELATTAKDPYNYFLLLRALFRSIGGGSHDLLYQEFLPLLPNLLQGLNQLQSGLHKQHMKDLFVELCLTVPVRLSSLLPYLPMLMDPLVSALNGSHTLVSQGLRTLELCVDNLQPDFLYEHIQPVRAELMQALWRTLRNRNDQIARVAFRVLGKLGGGNRKMLREPQRLSYKDDENDGPCITILFPDHKTPVHLPVSKVIETALSKLTSPTTDVFYRRQAWEVIRHFIVSMLSLGDEQRTIQQLLFHTSFHDGEIPRTTSHAYKCHDQLSRICFQNALTSMIVSATIKDLRPSSLPFMMNVVRHITLVAVAQQAGPLPTAHSRQKSLNDNMDPHVLVDAISACMAHEEKELCKTGQLAMTVIVETAAAVMGSKARACSLSIFEYVADRMCNCCYERAWYAKLGGCIAIKFMMENMDMCWVQSHLYLFLKALLFVMMDLTKEVSSGALNMAKSNVDLVLKLCATPPTGADAENPKLAVAQQKAFHDVTRELVREVTSPNQTVREQAMDSLRWLADFTNKNVMEIMSPHKEVLADMIPPKKHLLRHQPANAQRGLMDSNTFCTTLEPRLFTMDPTIPEHKVFFTELMNLCETEDSGLVKLPCYKAVPSLVPLRISALNALAACRYIPQARERIFKILFNALNSNVNELQEAGAKCMEKFIAGQPVEMEMVHTSVRPLLLMLGDHRTLNLNVIQRLHSLTQLFPNAFNEKLCEQMLGHLKKWLETTVISQKNGQKSTDSLKICTAILNIFHAIPAASAKILEHLLTLVIKAESALNMEVGSPFREPLLKYLLRYAQQTVDLFLQENNLKNSQLSRMFNYLLKHELAEPLRAAIEKNPSKLINLAFSKAQPPARPTTSAEKFLLELQYQSIRICATMVKHDKEWLPQTPTVFVHLRRIWVSEAFQERHRHDNQGVHHWEEPKLLVKCLLNYAEQHTSNVELLFQLLRVFSNRYLPNFQFLRMFLEETVAQGYSVEQKRHIFFKFVELFHDKSFPQELKAKALQYVVIPMFAASFDKGEGDSLIGGPPNPGQDSPDNLVSVFISKVIDPENPYGTSDSVRILLLQFAALLVERAAPHIHDAADKKQGTKLRRLMTFAWPCLIQKNCVDPTTKYHGHLLLAHNIAKFAIHKRIVLQVFHSLLKAHAAEARSVVRQALDILTPVLPQRMEDGNAMLTHWTKKIIVEEGYTIAQLVHMLQLLVRHYKVYYPVRHHLIQTMVYSIQRLGNTPNATLEHRKLVVELVEVIIKWEVQRIREDEGNVEVTPAEEPAVPTGVKRSASTDLPDPKRVRHSSSGSTVRSITSEASKPIEKVYSDAVVNFLIRLACQVNDSSSTSTVGSPGEQLSRRCMALLKTALRPDVWPNSELRLNFLDKLFLSVDTQAVTNYGNICAGLDVLNFLLGVMDKPTILSSFKPLQRGIAACMTCQSTKVIRSVHALLVKLMSTFPTESSTSNVASKYEELDSLYASVGKVIYEGLTAYEKATNGSPTPSLYGTLMILKAACTNNISYIDRLITVFMRALQKMAKEHLSPSSTDATSLASELLIISLDLVKNRVGVMSTDMRRNFVQVLTSVIEKSPDAKVLKTIVKMVEEWVKAKTPLMLNQSPSPREKTILLVKLMQYVEKRFPEESELNAQFLELVNWVYRDDSLAGSELTSKLEPAFLAGLRCSQPHIRTKFFEVFNSSIRRRLFDRLLYLIDSQNWEAMGSHYWLKQCVELLMASSATSTLISNINTSPLPCITSVINLADSQEKAAFMLAAHVKEEPMDVESDLHKEEDVEIDIELPHTEGDTASSSGPSSEPRQQLQQLINRDVKFLESLRNVKTFTFLHAVSQLCHSDTELTHSFWVHLFPKVWKILNEKEQTTLSQEVSPFLCSGSHHYQKDAPRSTIHTFVEAVSRCTPHITIRPCVLKYLGKSHNLWHRCILMLEQNAITSGFSGHHRPRTTSVYDFFEPDNTAAMQQETLDSLSELYERLEEEDLWAGLWQRRCKFPETATALSYEQQGFFEQAQTTYEQALAKARSEHNSGPASNMLFPEYHLWESHWVRCCKELSQWDILMEYGNTKGHTNPQLVLESAWRVPNWGAMKEALAQVEQSCPREMNWKVNLYRGFIAICHPDEKNLTLIERLVEMSSKQALEEWRRLPHYVTQAHTPLLQASQRIMELQEASQVHHGLQPTNLGRNQSLHDMKAIVKTWRNRLPMVSDDLSHWSDIFMWRQHHYQAIVQAYDNSSNTSSQDNQQHNHTMLGVHASAQSIINYGKVARKHSLIGPALDSLSRIHTIPSVPVVDCFQKIRQQVKCYLQMAGTLGKQELQEGLEVIESTNLRYFSREMTAEFYALKGMFLAQVGRSDEANKTFSAAVQMHDTLVKAWALWGDYLEQIFCKDKQMSLGESAITCFLHACRHQNESKSRKYLAKVLWLITYDDEKADHPLAKAVDKYSVGVPPIQWLPWIPQLLTCLVGKEGDLIISILMQVGRVYPQALYFPIRTLYLTHKIEHREKFKSGDATMGRRRLSSTAIPTKTSTIADLTTPSDAVPSSTPLVVSKEESKEEVEVKETTSTTTASSAGGDATTSTTTTSSTSDTTSTTSTATTPSTSTPAPGLGSSVSAPGPIRASVPMVRCSKIMGVQRDLHPILLSSLEGIVDQMVWFRENWYEEVLRHLRLALAKCQAVAFENRGAVVEAKVTPHTLSFVKKLVNTFGGVGIENVSSVTQTLSSAASELLVRRAQATAQDPIFQKLKNQFKIDFDFSQPGATKLRNLIAMLKKWIKIIETRTKLLPKSFLIEERCRFLSHFSSATADVELPGEFLTPKHGHYTIRIARFMPHVEITHKHNTAARRLYIRGSNGKIYPYLVVNDASMAESRREERVLQVLRMLNHYLGKRKETAKRQLQFTVPRVVAVSPQMRLVEDSPSSLSLLDIYKKWCVKQQVETDPPINRYYERLAVVQLRGSQASHQVLRDILKEVQTNMVPRTLLKEWALDTFPTSTDYFAFRKMMCGQLALLGLAEFVLHLTRLNPEIIQIERNSGLLSVFYFRFDLDETSGELDANRPVPFRLTPNIAEFLTTVGVNGMLNACMISIARCLVQPSFQLPAILKAVLRDEMIAWSKKKQEDSTSSSSSTSTPSSSSSSSSSSSQQSPSESELLITLVTKAINAIMTRLQNLAQFEGGESKVSTLVAAANSPDNLCRMDPAWHPWL